jgi:hypothetical protein
MAGYQRILCPVPWFRMGWNMEKTIWHGCLTAMRMMTASKMPMELENEFNRYS